MAAATAAAPMGVKDGLDLIVQDHQDFRSLFAKYLDATSSESKLGVVRQLIAHVSRHASAEERTLYPMIKEKVPEERASQILYERMYTDDQVNKEVLDLLDRFEPKTDAEWHVYDLTVRKFIMVETEHLDSEEREVIDPLRALLSSHDKERLYDDFTAARANAPTHPHPRAPQAPALLAKILHPVAGAVDRVRDAVTGREPVLP